MKLSKNEYAIIQDIIYNESGITLDSYKLHLVESRLYSRLIHYNIETYSDYLQIIKNDNDETREMVNAITTNETYFFREHSHFDFIKSLAVKLNSYEKVRIWSAACSVGVEAYTIAMVLDDILLQNQWDIVGTDINTIVVKTAQDGLYDEKWLNKIPDTYKKKYCLQGKGKYKGKFILDRKLAAKIEFSTNNLIYSNSSLGKFNVIFLRNVLLYFNTEIKQTVLDNVLNNLEVGGYLIISLTENLDGININKLKKIQSSVYQRVV